MTKRKCKKEVKRSMSEFQEAMRMVKKWEHQEKMDKVSKLMYPPFKPRLRGRLLRIGDYAGNPKDIKKVLSP